MKKSHTLFTLLLVISAWSSTLHAQTKWQTKGVLFEDKTVRVEIEYSLIEDPCTPGSQPGRFRYHVIHLSGRPNFYLAWRFDYFDCNHEIRSDYNVLPIDKNTPAYVIPQGNQFSAKQIVNHISYTRVLQKFREEEKNKYAPESSQSLEPLAIKGRTQVQSGETTLLSLKGGYLAAGATWQWYEGDCQGKSIGSGPTLQVRPQQSTIYYVRAEGRNNTPCVAFQLNVTGSTVTAASSINGPRETCAGNPIRLSVIGGKLGNNMHWTWYQDQPGGTKVGEGESIQLIPYATTTYYVRGEGPEGNTSARALAVEVHPGPMPAEAISGPTEAEPRSYQTFSVRSSRPLTNAIWVWYQLIRGQYYRVGNGSSIMIQLPSDNVTIAVRAESSCGNSPYTELPVAIRVQSTERPINKTPPSSPYPPPTGRTRFYLNGGIVAKDPDKLQQITTYMATIGGGNRVGWYLRGKFCVDQPQARYSTSDGQIQSYDQPGYYRYTGQHLSKRTAYTGGIYLGSPVIGIYLGGGYGEYQSLYQIEQYQYGNSYSGSAYVKDVSASQQGAEFEGGLLLRVGFFNLMGGVSSLQGKYTDYHAGIGFNF